MEILKSYLNQPLIEAIGWTLVHSLWQATTVVILLVIILELLKRQSAHTRYAIASLALVTCVVWSAITFIPAFKYAKEKERISQQIKANPDQLKEIFRQNFTKEAATASIASGSDKSFNKIKMRAKIQRNFPLIFSVWILGVMFFIIRLSGAMIWLQKLKTRLTHRIDENTQALAIELAEKIGLQKSFRILSSGIAGTSMVVGYLKPVILLPFSMASGLSTKELEAVIAHELAHIKRHDYLINIIQSVIETLYFFHPAIWIISKSIRNERENCCDEIAINATNDKVTYLKALTHAWELSNKRPSNYEVAFTARKSGLLQRAIKIKNLDKMKKNVTEGFIAASLVFLSLVLVSFSFDNQNLKTENTLDTENKVVVQNTIPPTAPPAPKSAPEVSADLDSINSELAGILEETTDELHEVMEFAYTYHDEELAQSIHEAMEEVRAEVNMKEIMQEVKTAIEEAQINEEVRQGLAEARLELEAECGDSMEIAVEAIKMAESVIEAVNVEEIVTLSLEQAAVALESINFEELITSALSEASVAIKEIDMEGIMQEVEDAMKDIEIDIEHDEHFNYNYTSDESDSDKKEKSKTQKEKEKSMEETLREIED